MCPRPGPGGEVRAARPGARHRLRGGQQGRGGAGGGGQVGPHHAHNEVVLLICERFLLLF